MRLTYFVHVLSFLAKYSTHTKCTISARTPPVSLGVLQRVGSGEVGNSSHGKAVTPWQPLPLEGVARFLPGFTEALRGEARAMASQLTAGTGTQMSCCAYGAPLSSVLAAMGSEPQGMGEGSRAEEGSWP